MNSKAIRKQLLAAVAMVLVAAVALGSSTYAWFVASGAVKAEGMSVKAQAEGGLIIRYKGGAWGTTATAGMDAAKELKPTSTDDLENWVYAQAAKPNEATANDSTFANVTSYITPGNGTDDVEKPNNYALVKLFQIRAATKENIPEGLYVESINVTGTQSMSTALRVGVVCTSGGTTTNTIFAPVIVGDGVADENKPSDTYYVMKPAGVVDGKQTFARSGDACELAQTGLKPDKKPYASLVAEGTQIGNTDETQATVYIYVWFEGEDHNLYSDNFYTENLNVAVNFTSISASSQNVTPAPTKVDLSTGAEASATDTVTIGSTTYYRITGKVALDGYTPLYAKAAGPLTSSSEVFMISGGVATAYNANVKLPDPPAAEP